MARRVTNHNGRGGKDGTYNVKHNDRNFDTDHAEHIDSEKTPLNKYWQIYKDEPTFEDNEKRFYREHFEKGLEARNKRYKEKGKSSQIKSIDDYREAFKSAPEETLYYIGDKDQDVDYHELLTVFNAFNKWHREAFPQCVTLDIALHLDEEGAPHIHQRKVWLTTDKFGFEEVNQSRALEDMGVQRPQLDKAKDRYNNPKMTYTKACRDKLIELCLERGIEVEIEPQEASKVGKSMLEYQTAKETEKLEQTKQELTNTQNVVDQLEAKADKKEKDIQALEEKAIKTKADIEAEKPTKTKKKIFSKREYVEVAPEELQSLKYTAKRVENVLKKEKEVNKKAEQVESKEADTERLNQLARKDREQAEKDRARAKELKEKEESYILGTAEKMVKDELKEIHDHYHANDDRLKNFIDFLKKDNDVNVINRIWSKFEEHEREVYEWERDDWER